MPTRRRSWPSGTSSFFDYGINTIVSLDLHWLFSQQLFVADDQVRRIHSFWFDDLRSHLQDSPMFSLAPQTPLDLMNVPKVSHHCYGRGQAEELRLLGVKRVLPSALAAPAEYLRADEPCTESRLAFVGNPGLSSPPTDAALAAMQRGENAAALRRLARQELLDGPAGCGGKSGVDSRGARRDRVAGGGDGIAPRASRTTRPSRCLAEAGRTYPAIFESLNRSGGILDAAMLVKFVNRYDRPGLVVRLARRGWLDVFGTPEQWLPYGITARPTVPFPQLASIYRRYPAHLNAANCARDASANEKLFEIAACARASLNIDSPDVRACYSEEEICPRANGRGARGRRGKNRGRSGSRPCDRRESAAADGDGTSLGSPAGEGVRMKTTAAPKGVLILSNDLLTPFAKTSDYLAAALERRRIPTYVRDNAEARLLTYLYSEEMAPKVPVAQEAVCDAMRELMEHAAIDTVLSLDMNWYVTPGLYVDDAAIKSIHSLWFDDFRSWCTSPFNPCFPMEGDVFQQHIKHPKVTHHFYGDSQAQEAKLLGVGNQRITRLAAPRHLIQNDSPCVRTDKLAFIGNPGFRGTPHEGAVKLMEAGAEIEDLRSFCRDAILQHPDMARWSKWFKEEPTMQESARRGAGGAAPFSVQASAANPPACRHALSARVRVRE